MIRNRQPEWMDDPRLDPVEHRAALGSLDAINRVLGINRRLFAEACATAGGPIESLLDVGTGGGGFLRHVLRRPRLQQPRLVIGLDRSANALVIARARGQSEADSETALSGERESDSADAPSKHAIWIASDAGRIPLRDLSVDVVVCSLFLHHLDEREIVSILREFARVARRGVVIGDLIRSRTSLALTWLTTRLASRSPVVHVDAPLSVRAALTPPELGEYAERAGLSGSVIRQHFPFRMTLSWKR